MKNFTQNKKEFWKITKPFMSHKGFSANTNISLIENDAIINDQTGVATVLNDYYVNVTKSILPCADKTLYLMFWKLLRRAILVTRLISLHTLVIYRV